MPYIKKEDRTKYLPIIDYIIEQKGIYNAGQLNYLFTIIANCYLAGKEESYQLYNDIIGAIEGCKLELYRRRISKYEDKKIKENGDVY